MLNHEIYVKDPRDSKLLNNGVAELAEDFSEGASLVLRYELETFVCDGQYAKGLESILELFLRNLDTRTEQPGVWISGFYGSGKSHLAKMLRALWTNHTFVDGATARGLARLPEEIKAHLLELSKRSQQEGGLHAAAGKLGAGAGDFVRMALLAIIFRSAKLPAAYNQARFVMWLRQEKLEAAVRQHLEEAKRTLEGELPHLFVSDPLAKALLAARPDFADSPAAARQLLKAQYPQATDVSNEDMVREIQAALAPDGRFPLTLVVLDEVQQYIGNDAQKTYQVQEITETLSKHFSGRLLFVATGQSALADTPNLQRLMGRFPSKVMLGDWDVENVTRQIILAKKPAAEPVVKQTLQSQLGEISRHLRGTKLEHSVDDEPLLTADYPILPVRRRLWERLLRTIDVTGTTSQLRNQLRVVHEAVVDTAELPVGHVVAADYLYDQNAANLVATAQLPREVYDNVQKFEHQGGHGPLKARVLKLIYLISKMPTETTVELGLRATVEVLADLLVTDLASGSSKLRSELPAVLMELQETDRLVMALEIENATEYRLQTKESSAWLEEFRSQESVLKNTPNVVQQHRSDALRARLNATLGKLTIKQGKDNESRTLKYTFDEALPKDHAQQLTVWIQDGWQSEERSVLAEARKVDVECPTIFVFVPAENRTELDNALVALNAAEATLNKKGKPTTEEGHDARRAMEKRQRDAQDTVNRLLAQIEKSARVFQAGGQPVDGDNLATRIQSAGQASVIRLYRDFGIADHDGWARVFTDAQKGNVEALKAVGHAQEPDKHPVCQKILAAIGPGKKGLDVREQFTSPPYGWSRDAVDGALVTLVASGHLKATDAAGKPLAATAIDRGKLTQTFFQQESITITPVQLIQIRSVFAELGLNNQPGQEAGSAPQVLGKLQALAKAAGGTAPAPEPPHDSLLDTLAGATGNALLFAIYTNAAALKALAAAWAKTWKTIATRQPAWEALQRLLKHAKALPQATSLIEDAEAIARERRLLADPDPVPPLRDQAAQLLREALNERIQALEVAFAAATAKLDADDNWPQLTPEQRQTLAARHQLTPSQTPDLGSAEAVEAALEACDLDHRRTQAQAVAGRFEAARLAAAQLIVPDVRPVTLPSRTLKGPQDLESWVGEVKTLLAKELTKGPVSV